MDPRNKGVCNQGREGDGRKAKLIRTRNQSVWLLGSEGQGPEEELGMAAGWGEGKEQPFCNYWRWEFLLNSEAQM